MFLRLAYDVHTLRAMGTLLNDLRYGLRLLRKNPGFTTIAILTMAIGIAANTIVFSWVHFVLLKPFSGVPEADCVFSLETVAPSGEHVTTSYPDYRDLRDRTRLFENIALAQPRELNLGDEMHAQRVWAELVSGNFFDLMRLKPAAGRFFSGPERDDTPGAHPVAVISYGLWTSRFHSAPAAIGSTIRINRYPFTIIGVAPRDFKGSMTGLVFEVWAPAMMYGQLTAAGDYYLRDRKTRMFMGLARLKPGVSLQQGRDEIKALMQRLSVLDADTNTGISATLMPMWKSTFSVQHILLAPLGILTGIAAVVLLLVCANVANLLLARATSRESEFSIRVALGGARGRLLRQLLTEALLMALAGAALGLALTEWLRGSLTWLMPATPYPIVLDAPLDTGVLAFSVLLAVFVAVAAGLAPALHAARPEVSEGLKSGSRTGAASARAQRLRGVLVVAEVALAAIALTGAGLFLKSFQTAKTINPGFDPSNVVIAQFNLSTAGYNRAQANSFCRRLRERLEAAPGTRAVSYADTVPLGFDAGAWEDLQIQGYLPGPSENMKIYRNLVAPGYFDLMRIPILNGRDFDAHDDEKSLPAMIVNQSFVRRFLPNQNPIGRKVQGWGEWFTIVGVVKNSKYHNVAESAMPYFYVPIRQVFRPEFPLTFHVRVAGASDQAIGMIRREAQAVDPGVAMFDAMPLTEYILASLFDQKVVASLLAALGAIAVLLASVGLYSVMAYSISQRTNEIGIRMALGAEPGRILRLVIAQGMSFALIGLLAGCAGAAALAGLATSLLIGTSPADPAVYGAVAVFLVAVSVIASWVPARRAMRVDPMTSLRCQ
jgi:predicted permease